MESALASQAGMLKALGDETRLRIFLMLAQGELCACKILEEFDITQPTLSYHMRILCSSGLVSSRKSGIWTRYTINGDAILKITGLMESASDSLAASDDRCVKERCV
ncbi:ArsR/SmtB family transcription factor [Youngiibacter multivorans]|uniref:ArsR family transcriptional regulator n=1 Tax=Youngiibacter multivorans TaxID=937251 RepID=A0ABS4G5I1_9CLOT|nr:metalloregulator ArsR/SmtB family transcription factor [Youngiibacter multivorans]MBP1919815.1 ArsR family transcriptional regulator [Youngiibacter multivorans]